MRLKRFLCLVMSVVIAVVTTGCASIVSDSKYPVTINSSPSGANFEVRNSSGRIMAAGTTPQTVVLPASEGFFNGADYTVEVEKGGSSGVISIGRGLDMWYVFGNLFIGGLLGWIIIDPATGAMWKLDDRAVVPLD